jgi:hypothetical protein
MSMRNIAPVVSTLDYLLRQSLAAVACNAPREDETLARLNAIFDRIAQCYRTTNDVVCQCVIDPGSAAVELDGRTLHCPRLLVQCAQPDATALRAVTFVYVPIRSDLIALDIVHGSKAMRTSQFIQWTRGGGWCTAGMDLDREGHAKLLRIALYESDLFASTTMSLEPLDHYGKANR